MKHAWEKLMRLQSNLWIPLKLLAVATLVLAMAGAMMLALVIVLEVVFWLAKLGAYAT